MLSFNRHLLLEIDSKLDAEKSNQKSNKIQTKYNPIKPNQPNRTHLRGLELTSGVSASGTCVLLRARARKMA